MCRIPESLPGWRAIPWHDVVCCVSFFVSLVDPVRRDARLRDTIHFARANLHLKWQAFWPEKSGMQ